MPENKSRGRRVSNELQKKLARRRDLNGEASDMSQGITNVRPNVPNCPCTPATSTSPKRKNETELDKKLTRRRILNGEGRLSERLSQCGGAVSETPSPTKRKRTTLFNLEQRLLKEELFEVIPELSTFQYGNIVDSVQSKLTLHGNTTSAISHFLVSLNRLITTEFSSQLNGFMISTQDDIVPILLNVFVRAMVGPRHIHLSVFDAILDRDSYGCMPEHDKTIISNIKAVADTAHNWLVVNHFIDLSPPVSGSVDVKIVMFGSYGTGKTALIERYTTGTFSGETSPTIGLDVQSKVCVMYGIECKAVVWDTAGQERFHAITENFLRGVDGVMVVYDACRPGVMPEKERLQLKKLLQDETVPTVLFGNKMDLLLNREVQLRYRKPSHFLGSALTGENVEEAFRFLTAAALERKLSSMVDMGAGEQSGENCRKAVKLHAQDKLSSSSSAGCCL